MKKIRLHCQPVEMTHNELAIKVNGFIMSKLSSDYAGFLHSQATNPYSLNVIRESDKIVVTVNLLDERAIQEVGGILLDLKDLVLESYKQPIIIEKTEIFNLSYQELSDYFYNERDSTTFTIRFDSPTSFKSQGDYSIFPSMRLIFQSLMQKYSRLVEGKSEIDEELLDFLVSQSRLTSYQLKTHYFAIHKVKIPAFRGSITFRLSGAKTLKSYAYMLLAFGEYSGVGIKTSLGMGGMSFEER